MNIEHQNIEAEAVEDEIANEESLADQFDAEAIQKKLMRDANQKAQQILKKNKKEIERLKKHAADCVFTNNYEGYAYSIKKLREFYKQKYTEQLIEQMWKSSRAAMIDYADSILKDIKENGPAKYL